MHILPHEARVLETGSVIQTRCPQAEITEKMIQDRAKSLNLDLGDKIIVQCIDHARTMVLAEAEYRVIGRAAKLQRVEVDNREVRQSELVSYEVRQVGEWWVSQAPEVKWNPGKKAHEVVVNGKVVDSFASKAEAMAAIGKTEAA